MGSVYIVEQESTGARRALKVMHACLLDDQTMHRRFATEARVCAQIRSPHVVQRPFGVSSQSRCLAPQSSEAHVTIVSQSKVLALWT